MATKATRPDPEKESIKILRSGDLIAAALYCTSNTAVDALYEYSRRTKPDLSKISRLLYARNKAVRRTATQLLISWHDPSTNKDRDSIVLQALLDSADGKVVESLIKARPDIANLLGVLVKIKPYTRTEDVQEVLDRRISSILSCGTTIDPLILVDLCCCPMYKKTAPIAFQLLMDHPDMSYAEHVRLIINSEASPVLKKAKEAIESIPAKLITDLLKRC